MQQLKYLFQLLLILLAIGFLLVVWPGNKKEEFEEFKKSLAEGKGFFQGIGEMFKREIPSEEEILTSKAETVEPSSTSANASAEESKEPSVYPIEMSVRNQSGDQIDVTIMGRSAKAFSMIRKSDRQSFTYPLASLSPVDNAALRALPITLREDQLPNSTAGTTEPTTPTESVVSPTATAISGYPLDLVIRNQSGKKIEITVMGRSEDTVSFIRNIDREAFAYPLSALSEAERAIILTLPVNLRADQLPQTAAKAEEVAPRTEKIMAEIVYLRERKDAEAAKLRSDTTTAQKQIARRKMDDYQDRIDRLQADLKGHQ